MRTPQKETEFSKLSNVLVTRLDVTEHQSIVDSIAAGVKEFGTIDLLVNNAGISGVGVFEQWGELEVNAIFDTNVYGPIRVTQHVLPVMRKRGEGESQYLVSRWAIRFTLFFCLSCG
jgi:NADP-dependent 3-hydroxy acid dehydrogenase YdfG